MTPENSPKVLHTLYFILFDRSEESCKAYIDTSVKYLSGHPGMIEFSIGTLAYDLRRNISDLNFDVAMSILFENIAAYEDYEKSPGHATFLKETAGLVSSTRAFDAYTS